MRRSCPMIFVQNSQPRTPPMSTAAVAALIFVQEGRALLASRVFFAGLAPGEVRKRATSNVRERRRR